MEKHQATWRQEGGKHWDSSLLLLFPEGQVGSFAWCLQQLRGVLSPRGRKVAKPEKFPPRRAESHTWPGVLALS